MIRKLFLTTALLLIVVSSMALATNTRILSMGGDVKYFTVMDDRNVYYLPAELIQYGNWAALELGNNSYPDPWKTAIESSSYSSFAFNYNLSETMVVGFMGSNEQRPGLAFDDPFQGDFFDNWGRDGPNHHGTVFFAQGDQERSYGARIGFYGQSNSTTLYADDEEHVRERGPFVLDFGAGASIKLLGGDIDIGVGYLKGSANDDPSIPVGDTPPLNQSDWGSNNTHTALSVLIRGVFPRQNPGETLIPFFSYESSEAKGQLEWLSEWGDLDDYLGDPFTELPKMISEYSSLTAGADLRIDIADGAFIQPGIGVGFSSYNYIRPDVNSIDGEFVLVTRESKSGEQILPFFNVAAEIRLWDWMDLRFGGAQYVAFISEEDVFAGENIGTKDEYSEVGHSLATGIGLHLPNDFQLDIQVHTDWWRSGPYLLTGDEQTFGLNAALSKDW